jgi:hypothetical protein
MSKPFYKNAITVIAAVVGGVGGAMLATPETYLLVDKVPGVAIDRQCNPSDMMCNEIRSREIYSGQGWTSTRTVNSEATLSKQFTFGGIGAISLGFAAFALSHFMTGKKSVTKDG